MNLAPIIVLSALLTFTTGCSKQTYTADYLLKDSAKRKEILADCKENKQSVENCNSANQAQSVINSSILSKKAHLELLNVRINNVARMQSLLGASENSKNEMQALQNDVQKTKAEMEALAKQ